MEYQFLSQFICFIVGQTLNQGVKVFLIQAALERHAGQITILADQPFYVICETAEVECR